MCLWKGSVLKLLLFSSLEPSGVRVRREWGLGYGVAVSNFPDTVRWFGIWGRVRNGAFGSDEVQ